MPSRNSQTPPRTEPAIENAGISPQSLTGSLQSTLDALPHAPAPFWVGYTVPADAPYHSDAADRKQAVFAISRLPQSEATDQLVNLAGSSPDPEVRKQAVFWLGPSNDPKALAFLTSLLTAPSH